MSGAEVLVRAAGTLPADERLYREFLLFGGAASLRWQAGFERPYRREEVK